MNCMSFCADVTSFHHHSPVSIFSCLAAATQLLKMCLCYYHGLLPANLRFKTPNRLVPALFDGRMKVVSENTPWNGGYSGINSFGEQAKWC